MKLGQMVEEPIINRLNGDKVIWVIVFLLSLISIALIYSSSSSLAFKEHTTNFAFLIKQLKFVIMGLVALYLCYKIPLGWYRFLAYPALAISIILLLLTPIIGKEVNGAKRWIDLGGVTFQPTEMAKIAIVLYLARALEISKLATFREFFIKIIIPIGLTCVLIMIGSVSSALFVGLISFAVLFIAGVKWSYLFKAAGIGGIALVGLIILHLMFGVLPRLDTATSRLKKHFTDNEISQTLTAEEKQREADKTFQEDMAKIAISSVGIIGKGPGKSTQRYVLPHPYSDYIYTIIIEEYGLVGGIFVLMLYLWFLYRCIIMVRSCGKVFTAITVGGLGLLITIQASLHILVNVGILPVTGHTLPLVSLGGTSLVILSCAFGIILSVSRTIDIGSHKKAKEQKNQQDGEVEQITGIEKLAKQHSEEDTEHEIIASNGEFK
ncbi:MAG: FtsW/RodA/SpoVE family cell cycle protein [Bacteroidales bacterium]